MENLANLIGVVIGVILYIYFSYSLQVIFQKLNLQNAWLAWIPIANLYMIYIAGDQAWWWIILAFIPLVNIVAVIMSVVAWVNIVQKLGKSPWLLLLFLVPILNFFLIGYLAFS